MAYVLQRAPVAGARRLCIQKERASLDEDQQLPLNPALPPDEDQQLPLNPALPPLLERAGVVSAHSVIPCGPECGCGDPRSVWISFYP